MVTSHLLTHPPTYIKQSDIKSMSSDKPAQLTQALFERLTQLRDAKVQGGDEIDRLEKLFEFTCSQVFE